MNEIRRIQPVRDSVGDIRAVTTRVERREEPTEERQREKHQPAAEEDVADTFVHTESEPELRGYDDHGRVDVHGKPYGKVAPLPVKPPPATPDDPTAPHVDRLA